jgi:uncharacterized protein YjbI with pentapeptide repeats
MRINEEGKNRINLDEKIQYDFFVGKQFENLIFPSIGDMSSFVFHEAKFENSMFVDIDFGSSDLTAATFVNCSFRRCSMIKTQQYETIYRGCIFSSTNFKNARLNSVTFKNCVLVDSSYEGAIIAKSIFEDSITIDSFNGISLDGSYSKTTEVNWCASLPS